DDRVDRPLARVRDAAHLRGGEERRRPHPRRRIRRRRSDGEPLARRQGAGARHSRPADRRVVVGHAAELIRRKRDGGKIPGDELSELILEYARGNVPDYQLAAFCMAVYFRGLDGAETFALTDAMIRSGETIDLHGALGRKAVDKHSTGGVGDKTSLVVGPIVA